MGWIYLAGKPPQGIWLWTDRLGWSWTSRETYPFVWVNAASGWWYFLGKRNEDRVFYDYENKVVRSR